MEILTQRQKSTKNGRAGSMSPPTPPHAPWPRVKLGEVCEIQRGGSPRPIKDFLTIDEAGLNWIKIGDVDPNGKYITKTEDKIKREGLSKTRQVSSGDFLLSNSMSFGRPYILKIDGCIHDGWLVLKGFRNIFDENFFYHLLRSDVVQSQFESLAHGSTVRNLNTDSVSKVEVVCPPLPEQRAIVAKLERELAAVDAMEKKFEEMEKTAETGFKAELKEAFEALETGAAPGNGTDGTNGTTATGTDATAVKRDDPAARRPTNVAAVASVSCPSSPSGPSQPPAPPAPCRRVKLGEVCEKIGSGATPLGGKKTYCESGISLIRSQNVLDLEFSFAGLAHISELQAKQLEGVTIKNDDVLLNITGDSVARVCVVDSQALPARVNQHVAIIRIAKDQSILPRYLAMNLVAYKPALLEEAQKGATRKALTKDFIEKFCVLYPPLPTQRAIVVRLDAARVRKEKLVAAARKGAETAGLLRKALLKEAFE